MGTIVKLLKKILKEKEVKEKMAKLFAREIIRKEVKNMKKLVTILTVIAMVLSMSGSAFATFSNDGNQPFTASVSPTTGTGAIKVLFSAALKNLDGSAATGNITWPTVEAQNTDWLAANKYVEAKGFETFATWGIQIYTDNKNGTPAYTGTGDPAGLVRADATTQTLPMCWRVSADKRFASGSLDLKIEQKYIATGDYYALLRQDLPNTTPPTPGDDYTSDTDFFAPWGWMLDLNTPGKFLKATPVASYEKYALIASNYGVTVAPGDPDVPGAGTYLPIPLQTSVYNIYLGAKFINAVAGKTYTTNKVTVQMFHLY